MTIQTRLIAALEVSGAKRLPDHLKGCVKMSDPVIPNRFYFVGTGGSLRIGRTRGDSVPVYFLKENLLA